MKWLFNKIEYYRSQQIIIIERIQQAYFSKWQNQHHKNWCNVYQGILKSLGGLWNIFKKVELYEWAITGVSNMSAVVYHCEDENLYTMNTFLSKIVGNDIYYCSWNHLIYYYGTPLQALHTNPAASLTDNCLWDEIAPWIHHLQLLSSDWCFPIYFPSI